MTDGHDYFSEEKRHARSRVSYPVAGVPLYRLTNLCGAGRYRIEKDILADPVRDTVLQRTRFTPLTGVVSDYHPLRAGRAASRQPWPQQHGLAR